MAKFVAFADLQIHNYRKFDNQGSRLNYCLDCLELITEYAVSKGIEYILIPGDFFDRQKELPICVINATVERMQKLSDLYKDSVTFIAISGNHDYEGQKLYGQPVHTSLKFLSIAFRGMFRLIDDSSYDLEDDTVVYGVPYYEYAEHFYRTVEEIEIQDSAQFNILMVHVTAAGFDNIPGNIDPLHPCFDRFDLIISGDIHHAKWLRDNFLMLGNPMHRDAGDAGEKKGFWVFDTDAESRQFTAKMIDSGKCFPQYIHVREGDKISEEVRANNYIIEVAAFTQAGDNEEIQQSIEKFDNTGSKETLVTNFFNEVDGQDMELLKVGLKLVKEC